MLVPPVKLAVEPHCIGKQIVQHECFYPLCCMPANHTAQVEAEYGELDSVHGEQQSRKQRFSLGYVVLQRARYLGKLQEPLQMQRYALADFVGFGREVNLD